MQLAQIYSLALIVMAALTVITNIVVEVLKTIAPKKLSANVIAVVIAVGLTLVTFFAVCSIYAVPIRWFYVVAAVVVGFCVAFAAMFGFDKLKQTLDKIKSTE